MMIVLRYLSPNPLVRGGSINLSSHYNNSGTE